MCVLLSLLFDPTAGGEELSGDWPLKSDSGLPAWMSVRERDGKPFVYLRLYVGPVDPYNDVEEANGQLKFTLRKNRKANSAAT